MSPDEISQANLKRKQLIEKHYRLDWFKMDPTGSPIFFGTENKRQCRFCDKVEPETTFNKTAHAIPDLVGNKTLFSYWECDSCNSWFNIKYEDQFGKYTHPARTFGQTWGKKGVPSLKLRRSWIDFIPGKGPQIYKHLEHNCMEVDENDKRVLFKDKREPYRPRSVYKCFA